MENKDDDNKSLIIFIIIMVFAGAFLMGLFQKCIGGKYNPMEDSSPWQPRHTQIINLELNDVNNIVFTHPRA